MDSFCSTGVVLSDTRTGIQMARMLITANPTGNNKTKKNVKTNCPKEDIIFSATKRKKAIGISAQSTIVTIDRSIILRAVPISRSGSQIARRWIAANPIGHSQKAAPK